MWVIRDGVRKKPADYRQEEWVAFGMPATEVDALVRKGARSAFCVCAILAAGESDVEMRAAYKGLGYRLLGTEPLMIHRMLRLPKMPAPVPIARVRTAEVADAVKKSARRTQALPEHLEEGSELRLYAAMEGEKAVGWVRSIPVGDKSVGVEYARAAGASAARGIGEGACTGACLADDKRHGIVQSVLLSSHTGAMLYPHVGYEQIGMLYLYKAPK